MLTELTVIFQGTCGNSLWINLWILWKSSVFPQVSQAKPGEATDGNSKGKTGRRVT